MKLLIPTLLLGASTAQQITTSFAFLRTNFGTDKIGFYGSVISVDNAGHTALALEIDNGTDSDRFGVSPSRSTFTIGPNMFEATDRVGPGSSSNSTSNDTNLVYRCDIPASPPDAAPSCTVSYGPRLARQVQCQSLVSSRTSIVTQLHTYSGRLSYSAGVETLVRTIIFGPNTRGFPSWCGDRSFVPSSGWTYPLTIKRADIGTYQLVITAGQEKLTATAGASASVSGATPTGSGAGAGAQSTGAGSTGAAMPMKTVAPMMAGFGVAVAAFL
ncbi:hypothetical protein CC86DRAFT_371634 [Ophiobolus disseminans]|uniref:Uncharacterized protein n=1 Tax=Ophiobolus disseminans TaxID=1469910 RepID=A0A6A6ZUI2_9PLEO|nr:hypothetical protein CC86DRAFT_371634 [Ophiobolus disseminans]